MVIKNKIIPFKGFLAINLFGIIFTREELSSVGINHEKIHTAQMKELGYILFYLLYIIEFLVLCFWYGTSSDAYYNISFEREAYAHQNNLEYLTKRKLFNQWRSSTPKKRRN